MAGCALDEASSEERAGIAELRIDAGSQLAANVARIAVQVDGGASHTLTLNDATGSFDGALLLPAGPHTLVARAFSANDALVGASRPVDVEVHKGIVTRAMIRVLELSPDQPVFSPIFDSLTFPTTTDAGSPTTFTISTLVPGGTPAYAWSSDCADAAFSPPEAATTQFTKTTEGTCLVTVVASANGFSLTRSFTIVVFPTGSNVGAVEITGGLIAAPDAWFQLPDLGCGVPSLHGDSSCQAAIASPSATRYAVNVSSWGGSEPASITVSDDCGGQFASTARDADSVGGSWLPPATGGLCVLTARVTNSDGVERALSTALLVRPGTVPVPPLVVLTLQGCSASSESPPVTCPPVHGGDFIAMEGSVSWNENQPGSLRVTDWCAGIDLTSNWSFVQHTWVVPWFADSCTTTLRATSLHGQAAVAVIHYEVAR